MQDRTTIHQQAIMDEEEVDGTKKQAFKIFYEQHYIPGIRYAIKLQFSRDDAEDLIHHCMVLAWERFDDYQKSDHPEYWFVNILKNRIRTIYRRQNKETLFNLESLPSLSESIEKKLDREQRALQIQLIADSLPKNYQEVFKLRLQGKTYSEISAETSITVKAAQRRMERTFQFLKENYKDLIIELLNE